MTLEKFLQKHRAKVISFEFGEYAMTGEETLIHYTQDTSDRRMLKNEVYTLEGENGTQVYVKFEDTSDLMIGGLEDPTDVIFRKWVTKPDQSMRDAAKIRQIGGDPGPHHPANEGVEVIAIMPGISEGGHNVRSYVQIGQHGACSRRVIWDTKPATPEEYASIKRELESAPYHYRFRVIKRWPR